MKKLLTVLLVLSMIAVGTGCGKNESPAPETGTAQGEADRPAENNQNSDSGLASKLCEAFRNEISASGDMNAAAEKVNAASEMDLVSENCSEGFLPGFSADIKGFSSGIKLQPMIGSIPFVAYVFETDDAPALLETLNANADPRWNICTEAKAPVSEVSGNYVFFVMVPAD